MKTFFRNLASGVFVAFIMLSACSSAPSVKFPRDLAFPVHVSKVFHADTSFNESERGVLNAVIAQINTQTNGVANLEIQFDLDWKEGPVEDLENMERNANQIVKIGSGAPIVSLMDNASSSHAVTLGYCKVNFDVPRALTKVYIIYDRINNTSALFHVAMHEILHSLRMKHVKDSNSIMFSTTAQQNVSLCMNYTDMKEFCRVNRCNADLLGYCE